MLFQILSTALLLLLVMDPGGNLPMFVSLLRKRSVEEYRRIILRESLIALAVLFLFLFFGEAILELLQVSQPSLGIGGAVILFLISLKMVFGAPVMYTDQNREKEPLVVPLAIPLLAGPSAITTIILVRSSQPILVGATALLLAWGAATLILLIGRWLARLLGNHVLEAMESLMGFLLAIIAVEMFVKGIRNLFT
ncbi:MAG: putative antibiotic transporter [Lentisphaerae bacterium ADurb.Bin242]|nr:MAG: putative antibiotic transporter [Lentisphaerae bacterium ADurb.Bin242]